MSAKIKKLLILGFCSLFIFNSISCANLLNKAIKNKVHFDANGGIGEFKPMTVGIGEDFTMPENPFLPPSKEYYFLEWNTEPDGTGYSYYPNEDYYVTNNFTLYAIWAERPYYKVTFYRNVEMNDEKIEVKVLEDENEIVLEADLFKRPDYIITGWTKKSDYYSDVSYEAGEKVTITSDTKFYAEWTATKDICLSFDANGGTGEMEPIENVIKLGKIVIPNCFFRRTGYTFVEWNTSSDGKGTTYMPDDVVELSKSLKLYAIWEAQK